MAFSKCYDELEVLDKPACALLRSKRLFVTGEIDSPHPDEADGSHCWCNQTQHVLGPDDQIVDRAHCVPGRKCYWV